MSKDFQSTINTDRSVHSEKTHVYMDWTTLNRWNKEKDTIPGEKPNGSGDAHIDPFLANVIERVALSFAGIFKEVMEHADILEVEIGKQALDQFYLGRIQDSCVRGVNLVYRLMVLYGKIPMKMEQFDLNDIMRGIDPLISRIMRDDITFEIDMADDDLPMMGDIRFMKQAIAELIMNANEALQKGGTITLATRKVKMTMNSPDFACEGNGGCALLSVVDTGKGFDDEIGPRIYRPFFTTKPKGRGAGLGLPLVNHVVRVHNGSIKIMSRRGDGTSVRAYLPLLRSPATVYESYQSRNSGNATGARNNRS
jgi:two-component system, cell cycle sensor histidine kinase and response regulator CckA